MGYEILVGAAAISTLSVRYVKPTSPPRWLDEWRPMEPLPVPYDAIVVALNAAEVACQPAAPAVVAVLLEQTLELFKLPDSWDRVCDFYIEVFDDVPPDLVELALKRIRRRPRGGFFPEPGELRAPIIDELRQRQRDVKRLLLMKNIALRRPMSAQSEAENYVDAADVNAVCDEAVRLLRIASSEAAAMAIIRPLESEPMTREQRQRVYDELRNFRLPDEDDPRVQQRLRDAGIKP